MVSAQNRQKETLSYLAGLLDADGYFGVTMSTSLYRNGKRPRPEWVGRIGLKQVTEVGPRLLKSYFEGYQGTEAPSATNGKLLHAWKVSYRKAHRCAKILLPYLRIKKEQAKLLIKLEAHKVNTQHRQSLTLRQAQYRYEIYLKSRSLNDVRGKAQNFPLNWNQKRKHSDD